VTRQYLTDERGAKVAVAIPAAECDAVMDEVADLACVAERRDEVRVEFEEFKQP
jgi:hypothetical protein